MPDDRRHDLGGVGVPELTHFTSSRFAGRSNMQENSLCFSDGYLEMRDLNAGFRFKVLKRGQNTPATNEVFDQRSARHVRGASAEPVYGVAAEGLDVLIQPPRAVRDNVIGDKNGAVWSRKAAASRMPVTRRFMVQTIAALRK